MNGNDLPQPDPALDAYLDGEASPQQRDQVLRRVEGDPRLRAECDRQAAIDASLRRLFAPPAHLAALPGDGSRRSDDRAAAPSRPRPAADTAPPRRLLRAAAMAAIILIGFGYAGWTLLDYLASQPPSRRAYRPPYAGHLTPTTFVDEYRRVVANGFQPDWVCADDAQFAQTFSYQLGEPLLFNAQPRTATMVGLSYAHVLSPRTIVFLGRAGGQPAMVFVDRVENDASYSLPAGSGLNLFRRQAGGLVLYELSALDQPALLDHFYGPSCPLHDQSPLAPGSAGGTPGRAGG